MYSPQRLHPVSYILSIVDAIKNNIIPFILIGGFQFSTIDFSKPSTYLGEGLLGPLFLLILFAMTFTRRIIEIYRTRYWIEGDYLVVTSGLFNLNRKELNIRRIQSMDTVQSIVHQLVGGVKLIIKTPSDGIELNMVTKHQSEWIQAEIEKTKARIVGVSNVADDANLEVDKTDEQIYTLSHVNLLFMAMTSGAVLVTMTAILSIVGTFQDLIPWEKISGVFTQLEEWAKHNVVFLVIQIIIFIFLAYVIGVIITMIKYYRFTLTRKGEVLKVRYGLFKVNQLSVPITKLQAVQEKKSFLRHLFGFTSYHFIITSDMKIDGNEDDFIKGSVMVLPFIKKQEGECTLRSLVPVNTFPSIEAGLPWRGFHRRFWLITLLSIVIGAVVHYYFSAWVWLVVGLINLYLIMHSFIATRFSGSALTEEEVSIRKVTWFGFEKTTFKKDKILGFGQTAHPFMQRQQLAHFSYTIARAAGCKNIGLRFEDQAKVSRNKQWYLGGGAIDEKDE